MYEQGFKRKRNVTKSEENPNGMLVTPEMGGTIVLSVLQKGKGHIALMRAKMDERGIEPPMPLEKMKWKEVTDLPKIDKYKELIGSELARELRIGRGCWRLNPNLINDGAV